MLHTPKQTLVTGSLFSVDGVSLNEDLRDPLVFLIFGSVILRCNNTFCFSNKLQIQCFLNVFANVTSLHFLSIHFSTMRGTNISEKFKPRRFSRYVGTFFFKYHVPNTLTVLSSDGKY